MLEFLWRKLCVLSQYLKGFFWKKIMFESGIGVGVFCNLIRGSHDNQAWHFFQDILEEQPIEIFTHALFPIFAIKYFMS